MRLQLIETRVANIVNYRTLVGNKGITHQAGHTVKNLLLEFGSRRAQEMDAAIWGARVAYIAGFDSTSNVRAGKLSLVFLVFRDVCTFHDPSL